MKKNQVLLENLRNGVALSFGDRITLVLILAYPTIIAMLTTVVTEYIDAAMVGRLGADKAASIGLISSTMWLVGGMVGAFATGFQVQVAHCVGAKKEKKARALVRHGLLLSFCFALILMCIGLFCYRKLPFWLGGRGDIARDASRYAVVYVLMLPIMQISRTSNGMLNSSGNTGVTGAIGVLICVLDVIFNFFLIFEPRDVVLFNSTVHVWGAGLDVMGASLGTMLAETAGLVLALYYLFFGNKMLKQRREDFEDERGSISERVRLDETMAEVRTELGKALRIASPVAVEQMIMNSAQVMITRIIVPLGAVSIAANSFAITAESFCYMPGYGVAIAATTLVGQSIGAGRKRLAGQLAYTVTAIGMVLMTVTGVIMYVFAPQIMALISPDAAIQELGTTVLRIEAFAEPLFAASMVVGGVFRGTGNTLFPSIANLISMWAVRIPLAAYLSSCIGLKGAWIAMCLELSVRGLFFIAMLVIWKKRRCSEPGEVL
ncbi:MAG: MATE family efflux transporter [Lachnospiraceae bacterium]|nr:MATE family efflux transporter [Lachnospiraceae bacterium]